MLRKLFDAQLSPAGRVSRDLEVPAQFSEARPVIAEP